MHRHGWDASMTIKAARVAGIGFCIALAALVGLWTIASSLSMPLEDDRLEITEH
jgi:hypothetical protein